jgi:hypothetical protein
VNVIGTGIVVPVRQHIITTAADQRILPPAQAGGGAPICHTRDDWHRVPDD